ncbi:hypothetical protein LMG23992_03479 [Cupriavidus laharis]|uniref:Uncharacterized protein n=1 Tax=Cupriavidus laharis TaxID=151654 RepID=A0ABN7YZV9_9BURK|nr:hypothetical protein [Cupriavidus laharis]CAG9177344.1 hypothetical protein LMG23992_03479 [Cupriavidus laharis]
MRPIRIAVTTLATAFLAWPYMQAHADPAAGDVAVAAPVAAVGSGTAADEGKAGGATRATSNPFGATVAAVASDKLDGVRGGADLVVNDMRLHGTVADNAAIGTYSGSNIVTDGAFANAAGIPTAIQNTGNNVLIQNATIVNVQFK